MDHCRRYRFCLHLIFSLGLHSFFGSPSLNDSSFHMTCTYTFLQVLDSRSDTVLFGKSICQVLNYSTNFSKGCFRFLNSHVSFSSNSLSTLKPSFNLVIFENYLLLSQVLQPRDYLTQPIHRRNYLPQLNQKTLRHELCVALYYAKIKHNQHTSCCNPTLLIDAALVLPDTCLLARWQTVNVRA